MKNKLFILSFSIVFIGIGILSLIPPSSGIELGEHDKWNHFIAYLVLSLNWCLIKNKRTFFFLGLLLCGCYGLSLEYLQGFIPGRVPSLLDTSANIGGVVTGFILYVLMKPQRLV
jgi:VanZ family protein